MGGPRSGNHWHWWRPAKRVVVEQCQDLDLAQLARDGALEAGNSGTVRWYKGEKEVASVGYLTSRLIRGRLTLYLMYSTVGQDTTLPVRIVSTLIHNGGQRLWGVCPLAVGGRPCDRRVGKLYKPPGARYFGCRKCHGLTYTSCQESNRQITALRAWAWGSRRA